MRELFDKGNQRLGRHVVDIVVVHGVEGVDQRLFQLFGDMGRRDADAEFLVQMNDIRVKVLDHLEAFVTERHSDAVIVKPFEGFGRAVEHPVLNVVAVGIRIGGDD